MANEGFYFYPVSIDEEIKEHNKNIKELTEKLDKEIDELKDKLIRRIDHKINSKDAVEIYHQLRSLIKDGYYSRGSYPKYTSTTVRLNDNEMQIIKNALGVILRTITDNNIYKDFSEILGDYQDEDDDEILKQAERIKWARDRKAQREKEEQD